MMKDSQSIGQDGDRLDSWKKIAAYLGKDVRTAMRWSKDEGMPVYRHSGSKRGAIYAYRSEIDDWIHSDRSVSSRFYRKPVFVWAGAGLVLALIVVIALLWENPAANQHKNPAGERTWVLITDFENRSGEARFDDTVETALRRELANSRHVLVVAPERVRDTLALMKRSPDVTIDRSIGREICLRYGGVCTLLTGQVEKFDSSYLFSLELVDPADGRVVASVEEQAAGQAKVLPAIHRLGNWLRENLGEELAQVNRSNEEFEKVTTPSLRALELYSRGMQVMYLYKWTEAETLFRQAVDADPEFASANLLVFWALANQKKGSGEEAQSFLDRAMELADSASESERLFIQATYYDLFERNYEKACGSYKALAELFPDHYWAAWNAIGVCYEKLGYREDYVRYSVQGAELRVDTVLDVATAFTLVEGDFVRARPYVERLRGVIADRGIPGWKSMAWPVVFTELFAAEEFLDKGMLQDVMRELKRVELLQETMDASFQYHSTHALVSFYLALGQFQKAQVLAHEVEFPDMFPAWFAFLAGDQAAFQRHIENFSADFMEETPDPTERLLFLLSLNLRYVRPPLDVLAPMYDPNSATAIASLTGEPSREFLSWPKLEAKLQIVGGKQLLDQSQAGEAIAPLKNGVRWFRNRGGWQTFPYYFLGTELLAAALVEQGDLQAAYRVLEDAVKQRNMVNSLSTPLHQRVQARLALLARELGRTAEAELIEAALAETLKFADEDHPILIQIREHQGLPLEIE
jgi:tetratricopeptide (TPR) repeat protein